MADALGQAGYPLPFRRLYACTGLRGFRRGLSVVAFLDELGDGPWAGATIGLDRRGPETHVQAHARGDPAVVAAPGSWAAADGTREHW